VNDLNINKATSTIQTKKERFVNAAGTARNWTVTLLFIFLVIKIILFFTEPAISLKWWEWIIIWPAISYQHLVMCGLIFAVYLGLFFLTSINKPLKYIGFALAGGLQILLPFLHISSLRVAHILGGYTTFEMVQADSEGSIYTHALLDPENLLYTVPGVFLSIGAVLIPVLVLSRYHWWPKRLSPKLTAAVFAVWIAAGTVSSIAVQSYVGVADQDPIIFYFADMLEKSAGDTPNESISERVTYNNTTPIFGDTAVYETQKLFSNLDKWRQTKKNVVLIVLESLPTRQASFMGKVQVSKTETRDTMPNIRKQMKHGLRLQNHYTVYPASMNALFSMGCSLYPYPAGGNITRLNPRIPCHSFSEVLAERGYKGALYHSGRFSFWNKLRFYRHRGFSVMEDAKNVAGHDKATKFQWGLDEFVTAKAVVGFMKKNRNRSFFVQYIPVFPHAPYAYLPGDWAIFSEKEKKDKYHNCLRYADAAINVVLEGIRELKLEEDTLIIFVGDHGEAFQEHRGNRVHSIYIYEENVHVAAAMVNPILFPKSRATRRVTSHIDLLPTVADLVGIDRKKVWHGQSLLRNGPSRPVYFFANWGPKLVGIRDGKYKAMWERRRNTYEIYDLSKDPFEKKNLKDKHSERIAKYREAFKSWWEYQVNLIPNLGKTEEQKARDKARREEMENRKKKKRRR
jgi:arylsulfatase A-like enzyme